MSVPLLTDIADGIRRLTMSREEYVEWADEDTHAEWVDGEVIVHAPPKEVHQRIVGFIYELLSQFVRLKQMGTVYFAPFEVTLWEDGPARAPDVFFIAGNRDTSDPSAVSLNLVVEVISPGTVIIDRNDKLREYEEAGVGEYWIIDSRPGYERADFYRLGDDGRYALFATEDDDVIHSTVLPGFWLRPSWLWHDQLPNPLLLIADIVDTESLMQVLRGERATVATEEPQPVTRAEPRRLTGNGDRAASTVEEPKHLAPPEDETPLADEEDAEIVDQ